MRVPTNVLKQEFVFAWPLNASYPEEDRARFIFVRPDRVKRRKLEGEYMEDVTDERRSVTTRKYNLDKLDEIMALSLVRIENIENERGEAYKFANDQNSKLNKIRFFFESNMGLDINEHGILEEDLTEWFSAVILRRRNEEREKNLQTQLTDTTGDGQSQNNEEATEKPLASSTQ